MAVQTSFISSVIGADLGFGFTKTMTGKGGLKVFPSLVTVGSDHSWQAGFGSADGYRIQWDGMDWLVGEVAAVTSRTAFANRSRDRVNDPETMALFYAALAEQFPDGADNVIVMTGLPIRWMSDKEVYRNDLPGMHTVVVNGKEVSWRIAQVWLAPQGFGAICDEAINLDGAKAIIRNPAMLNSWTSVFDIGTLTSNLFTFHKNTWVEKLSDSNELGVSWVYEEVRRVLDAEFAISYEDHEIDEIIRRGAVSIQGTSVNTDKMLDPALKVLAKEQSRAIKARLGQDFQKIDQILVSGGGAHRLGGHVVSYLAHDGAKVAGDPGWANARGFYKWGVLRSQ